MNIDLTGKRILVTGASRGIGLAIAQQMSASGAHLVLHSRQVPAADIRASISGDGAKYWVGHDLSDPKSGATLVTEAAGQLGGLDIIVNNAAIAIQSDPTLPLQEWMDDWNHTMRVNLDAIAAITHAALPIFCQQQQGRFINITSRAAFRGDTPHYMAYAASKGGLVALTRSVARGYGKQGIKAFLIAPGFTETAMAQDFIDTYGAAYVTSDLALSSITQPHDIAPMVVLLASGYADHATGACIDINAGSYVR